MRRLLALIGVAHSRCPLAQAIAVGVRELVDDRDSREHIEQLSGHQPVSKRSARTADTAGRATHGGLRHGQHRR